MSSQESNKATENIVHPQGTSFLLAEYGTLRDEILKRIDMQYQLTALTLTGSGIILTIGLQAKNASILFIYPILTLFLAGIWANTQVCINGIGIYIRENIETRAAESSLGWEHWAPQIWKRPFVKLTATGSAA